MSRSQPDLSSDSASTGNYGEKEVKRLHPVSELEMGASRVSPVTDRDKRPLGPRQRSYSTELAGSDRPARCFVSVLLRTRPIAAQRLRAWGGSRVWSGRRRRRRAPRFWQRKSLKLVAKLMEFCLQSISLRPDLSVQLISPRVRKKQHRSSSNDQSHQESHESSHASLVRN
jgi:hypothetical protein